ncbi:MAG TPA: hypothetical protein PLK29_05755 [Chiayiivirga sp.]|nr:hypothetical protein [Chiayiivirga sp.]
MNPAFPFAISALLAGFPAQAAPPRPAPPLPPIDPTHYTIIHVATAQELADAAWNLQSHQAIVIAPGEYRLDQVNFPNGQDGRITVGRYGAAPIVDVQIRGATGNRDDVVLRGAGMLDPIVPYGIQIFTASQVVLADFSVGEVYYHAIGIQGPQGARAVRIHNVRAFDAGQQIIKGSGAGADDVEIAHSLIDYTVGAVNHPEGAPSGSCYTNGIDATGGHRWIIRDSRIERIRCQDGSLAGPAILMWQGAADTVVERNLILDSSRGISLGLVGGSDHSGGLVRNNLIRWNPGATYAVDVPIFTTSPGARILFNTVLTRGRYGNAIEARFASAANVDAAGNLLDAGIQPRNGASITQADNRSDAQPGWFLDEATADLRLSAQGLAALAPIPRRSQAPDDCMAEARTDPTEPGACTRDRQRVFGDGFEPGG